MSINIEGVTTNRFGQKLPTPYMEKIWIKDGLIQIQMSVYIEGIVGKEDSDVFQDYIRSLRDLKYSVIAVMDGTVVSPESLTDSSTTDPVLTIDDERYEKYGPIEMGSGGTKLFHNLKAKKISVFDIARYTDRDYSGALGSNFSDWTAASALDYMEFTPGGLPGENSTGYLHKPNNSNVLVSAPLHLDEWDREILYKSDGIPVFKYTTTINIVDNKVVPMAANSIQDFITAMATGLETHFVAFTTSVENYPELTRQQLDDVKEKNPEGKFLDLQVSDLCYELVSRDNSIKSDTAMVFKTPAGTVYEGDTLQAIDSIYYGETELNNKQIISIFNSLIGSTTDEDLQDKYDNLAYILTVYGQEVDILPRLNTFRKTFLETSTATAVGRFHEKLEIRLFNTNNAIKRGTRLAKFLNLNPVVVDARSYEPGGSYTLPYINSVDGEPFYNRKYANEFIYTSKAKLGSFALPSGTEWNKEDLEAAYQTVNDAKLLAKENADAAYEVLLHSYHEFLDMIQLQCFVLWDGDAISEYVNDTNNIDLVYTFDVKGGKFRKHHHYEWSDTKHVIEFEPESGWNRFLEKVWAGISVAFSVAFLGVTLGTTLLYDLVTWSGWANTFWRGTGAVINYAEGVINDYVAAVKYGDISSSRVLGDFREGWDGFESRTNLGTDGSHADWVVPPENIADYVDTVQQSYNDIYDISTDGFFGDQDIVINGEAISIQTAADLAYFQIEVEPFDEGLMGSGAAVHSSRMYIPQFPLADIEDLYMGEDKLFTSVADINGEVKEITFKQGMAPSVDKMRSNAVKKIQQALTSVNRNNTRGEAPDKVFDPDGHILIYYSIYVAAYKNYIVSKADFAMLNDLTRELKAAAEIEAEVFYDQYNLYLEGFVFFDYEKALKGTSKLSNIMSVNRIESLFGRELTHSYYNMQQASLTKWHDSSPILTFGGQSEAEAIALSDGYISSLYKQTWLGEITTYFEPAESAIQAPTKFTNWQAPELIQNEQTGVEEIFDDGNDSHGAFMNMSLTQEAFSESEVERRTVYSCFMPRSFKFPNSSAEEQNYRLVAFELVDSAGPFEPATRPDTQGSADTNEHEYGDDYLFTAWQPRNYYTVQIKMQDKSQYLAVTLIQTYEKMLNVDFEKYYELAVEECSYNNSDSMFNKFFVDGIIDAYSESPHDAPWYRAPIVYHTHLDLILNTYGGNKESIKAAALRDAERIHPAIATLEQLFAFRQKIQTFWENYYGPEGQVIKNIELTTIQSFVSEAEKNIVVFGGHDPTSSDYVPGYAATIRNIPNPLNISHLGHESLTGDVVEIDTDLD